MGFVKFADEDLDALQLAGTISWGPPAEITYNQVGRGMSRSSVVKKSTVGMEKTWELKVKERHKSCVSGRLYHFLATRELKVSSKKCSCKRHWLHNVCQDYVIYFAQSETGTARSLVGRS